ncbi:TetR family transcriptional regulator [Alteromonas confluentis]|uniref:TetR family transcriptional regulator n=1 Tax=Alteromonas confluentis TaxID=1656094 RepID=A0A1E7ZAU7_9ALTE|nr:TetR family transcriptional regulator [Alteromonas confluentis]
MPSNKELSGTKPSDAKSSGTELVNKKPRRGRPPKAGRENTDTRAELIRSGLEHLTEFGFSASGIDTILKKVGVPKGSFYFYFASKEAFGHAVVNSYASYFAEKLQRTLKDESVAPLARVALFVDDASAGMKKHDFTRGCLVGNLGQEVDSLPESFRGRLIEIFSEWQEHLRECLQAAIEAGELAAHADCDWLAEVFWSGWEGAVSRAKLEKSARPLASYLKFYLAGLPK